MLYLQILSTVLSVIILETTKTPILDEKVDDLFYRSQFWRLQKHFGQEKDGSFRFYRSQFWRLQKHFGQEKDGSFRFYRSQFWRL